VSSWRQQALIDAPVREVWALLEDPASYPEWNADALAVTGAPTSIEKGSTVEITGRVPLGRTKTTTYEVEAMEDLREIKLRCQTSGYYSHWVLTDARGGTFTEIELGVERIPGIQSRIADALHTKGYLRRAAEQTLDNLRSALAQRSHR